MTPFLGGKTALCLYSLYCLLSSSLTFLTDVSVSLRIKGGAAIVLLGFFLDFCLS
jgi:hypothetical protein